MNKPIPDGVDEMGPAARLLDVPAAALVGAVRFSSAHRLTMSVVALAATLVVGVVYLTFGVFHLSPISSKITVRVHFSISGGLLPQQEVMLRGVPVGKVNSVELTDNGVVAVAEIDGGVEIPQGGEVRVAGLSMAGEQYLDFRPTTDSGPFLVDGSEVSSDETSTPVPLASMLGNLDGMLAQIDPAQLEMMVAELGVGPEGPKKLAAILDGGTFLVSTLDAVLPQTATLLRSSKVLLGTLGDVGPGLSSTTSNLSELLRGVEAKDAGLREFFDNTPSTLKSIDALIADNSPTMVQLLGNLTTVAQMAYLNVPALQEFFAPTYRQGSTLEALATVFHDGGIWAFVNIYPRYSCDYNLPRLPAMVPDFPEPYLYTYCDNEDPSVLVRGARNAPRQPGDDTAGPPAGVVPDAQATPTPIGPQSIPLPYGGPDLEQSPPG